MQWQSLTSRGMSTSYYGSKRHTSKACGGLKDILLSLFFCPALCVFVTELCCQEDKNNNRWWEHKECKKKKETFGFVFMGSFVFFLFSQCWDWACNISIRHKCKLCELFPVNMNPRSGVDSWQLRSAPRGRVVSLKKTRRAEECR